MATENAVLPTNKICWYALRPWFISVFQWRTLYIPVALRH